MIDKKSTTCLISCIIRKANSELSEQALRTVYYNPRSTTGLALDQRQQKSFAFVCFERVFSFWIWSFGISLITLWFKCCLFLLIFFFIGISSCKILCAYNVCFWSNYVQCNIFSYHTVLKEGVCMLSEI